MRKILVLFGGVSSEHQVSLASAQSVISNIPSDKHEVVPLGITEDGKWFVYTGDIANLPGGKWLADESNLIPAVLSPDRSHHGIIRLKGAENEVERIDAVFPVLHGKNGEDGTIQGLFQLAGIPFVGCDMLSSATSMDKASTNTLADSQGVAQAKWLGIRSFEYAASPDEFCDKCASYLGFPMFVKPANAGSSVGISKVKSAADLAKAIELAFVHDSRIVVEQGIDGIEVECAVLGNDNPIAPMVGEVVPCNEFYDYDAKYLAGDSELYIPARISPESFAEVQAASRRIFGFMGCSGLARIDFFIQKSDGAVLFNEINTIPGFTPISMYSKMFAAAGIAYPELLDRLISLAFERTSNEK